MIEPSDFGLVDSPPDDRDWPLEGAIADNPVPTERAYRAPLTLPNANQFAQNSTHPACVAYSGCNTRIITEHLVDGTDELFAQLELYQRCKATDGAPTQPGTYIRAAADVLTNRGAAVGLVPAGRTGGLADPVSPVKYMPISGYVRVDETVLTEIKKAIYYLGHCWAAIRWYTNWNPSAGHVTATNPVLPKPGTYATGHGIALYGWDDDVVTWAGKGALRFKNSFGGGYGDHGDALIPYQLLPSIIKEAWGTFDAQDHPVTPAPPTTPTTTPTEDATVQLVKPRTNEVGDVAAGTQIYYLDAKPLKLTSTSWNDRPILAESADGKYLAMPGPSPAGVQLLVLVDAANVTGRHTQ